MVVSLVDFTAFKRTQNHKRFMEVLERKKRVVERYKKSYKEVEESYREAFPQLTSIVFGKNTWE